MASTGIIGTGSCLPSTVVLSDDVDRSFGVEPGWTRARTGIRERRRAPAGMPLTDLAIQAGRAAIDEAGVHPLEIRAVIVATVTADPPIPAVATRVQASLGAANAFVFDINAACAGFLFALEIARPLIQPDSDQPYVLVIGCDTFSRLADPNDRRTAPLFGDGAGAVVLGPVDVGGIVTTKLQSRGELGELAVGGFIPPPPGHVVGPTEHYFRMRGRDIADLMCQTMPKLVNDVVHQAGVTVADVDFLICHQANPELVARCAELAGFALEQVVNTGEVFGNTASASLPIGIDVASKDGRLRAGSLVLLVAFGAGMSWGSTLLRWSEIHRSVRSAS